jgi:hypothetical protein
MKVRRLLQGLLLLAGMGCSEYQTEPLPLQVTVKADKLETVPGDSVSFELTGQGGVLTRFFVVWGDGTTVEAPTFNARTATVRLRHAYAAAGMYEMNATLHDESAGSKTSGVTIRIR